MVNLLIELMDQSLEVRAAAIARDKFLWDLDVAKQAEREKGREEGIEIGEKKGREEGIEIGEKRGRQEGREEGIIQTAKAMIAAGFDIEAVCKATGLSPEELT
jgi:predicted transposase/invertase (TIGR01784 family)